jgi:hypothetical protein
VSGRLVKADLKRDPHAPFSVLKKEYLKLDLLWPLVKTNYTSKKFEINLFWKAMIMDDELKKNLKKVTEKTEIKLTESILRWKYKKEGKEIPAHQDLEGQSRLILNQAHKTISRRGKNIWNELKKAYQKKGAKEE